MSSTRAALVTVWVLAAGAAMGQTHTFVPQTGAATYAVRPPVLRVKPGDIVESSTMTRAGDYYEKEGGAWPGEVGPFYIEGAAPDDTLVVRILRVRLNRDTAVSFVRPAGLSALATDGRLRQGGCGRHATINQDQDDNSEQGALRDRRGGIVRVGG
jgi:hypothetical protein